MYFICYVTYIYNHNKKTLTKRSAFDLGAEAEEVCDLEKPRVF